MGHSRRPAAFRVRFDEAAWAEDLQRASSTARGIAIRARAELERDGITRERVRPCQAEGPGGTALPGCVKTYLPAPDGRWGAVLLLANDRDGVYLSVIAFGQRHPAPAGRQPSVYQVAHRRLHGS